MIDTASLRKLVEDTVGRSLKQGTVTRVHADRIDVQVGGSPKILRGLPTVGGASSLSVGDNVLLREAGGLVYAQSTKAQAGGVREVVLTGTKPHTLASHLDEDRWHAARTGSTLHIPKVHAPSHGHDASDPIIHIGSTAPASPYPGMFWLDTS